MDNADLIPLLPRMAADPAAYRANKLIEVSGQTVRYADVCDPWQEADAKAMDEAWLRCVGRRLDDVTPMRALLLRPRGASKTADLAGAATWAMAFAPKPIRLVWVAGDRDQAKFGRDAIAKECELNPWVGSTFSIKQWVITNTRTGSELQILASDAATGFGHLVDGVLIDEIANWPDTEQAKRFWQMVASTISKKRNCVAVAISNAGRTDSWQWDLCEAIRQDPDWYFHSLQTRPSWITDKQLAEQRRLLPAHAYSRLYENVWTAGTDSGVSPKDLEACIVLDGPNANRRDAYDFVIGSCDLGWSHDRTGLVALGVDARNNTIDLLAAASWSPADYGGELPLEVVEQQILYLHNRLQFDELVFDPREATGLSQRLCNANVPCARINLAPVVQNEMALLLLQAFNQRRVRLYRHADLIRDLLSLEVVDRTIGLKLQAARNSGGHSDLGFAFAIGLYAVSNYSQRAFSRGGEVLYA